MANINPSELFDKAKGIILDRFDRWLLLGVALFWAALIAHTVLTRSNIKDYENVLSWMIAALTATIGIFVIGEIAQKPTRQRQMKLQVTTPVPPPAPTPPPSPPAPDTPQQY